MRNILLFTYWVLLSWAFPSPVSGQMNYNEIRKEGHQVLAYRVDAAEAEKYIRKDNIDIDVFLSRQPSWVFHADSVDGKKLAIGHYVLLRIEDNRIVASLIGVSDLSVYTVNNQQRVQLFVQDKQGDLVRDAIVWVNGKKARYQQAAQSFWVRQKNPAEALIKIYSTADTLFSTLTGRDRDMPDKSVWEQRWNNFRRTWFARSVAWAPGKIGRLFSSRPHYRSSSAGATGLMVFNQPKYKFTDTVRLKAYLFSKKWQPYQKAVDVYLEYYFDGSSHSSFLKKLEPSSPGSYLFQFPLSDSLYSDINYSVVLRTKDKKRVISKNFRIGDYLLDEISSYAIRTSKDDYYPGDTMRFYTSAKDANGLPLLDARARLVLLAEHIDRFYPDTLYVPDTLSVQEKPLLTDRETSFDFPTCRLPDADLRISAKLEFINRNNELQEKDLTVGYSPAHSEFVSFTEGDSIVTRYREDGKIVKAAGILKIRNGRNETRKVSYPWKGKIDPLAESYSFYRLVDGKTEDSVSPSIDERYEPDLDRISRGDTLGFTINNSFRIPISFTVFDGSKIVGCGTSGEEHIGWTILTPHKNHAYRVNYQYRWKGVEQIRDKTIALFYKLLNIEVKGRESAFPGQKDTIVLRVKDYKNRPAAGVNLTAFSYNKQFSKDIHVPEPPYLVKYKLRPGIRREQYDGDDGYVTRKYPLGLHDGWRKKFGLDSMLHYQMLFPAGRDSLLDVVRPVQDFLPQLSVHVVQKGERQEIYLLYINRRLLFYNEVTERMSDAYLMDPGYTQIGIRLYDKFIQIDSIYVQPNYKHDLFIDLDHLPVHATVNGVDSSLSADERSLLERTIWQLDNNDHTNYGYVWQDEKLVWLLGNHPHLAGPFQERGSLQFFAPGGFDIHFLFENGYQYDLSKQVLRLEKKRIFPDTEKKVRLIRVPSPQWIIGDTLPPIPVISYPVSKTPARLKFSHYNQYEGQQEGNGMLLFTIPKDTVLDYIILLDGERPDAKRVLPGNLQLLKNIEPGDYKLLLVCRTGKTATIDRIRTRPGQTLCIHTEAAVYRPGNELLLRLMNEQNDPVPRLLEIARPVSPVVHENIPVYPTGSSGIMGRVTDKKGGNGIPGASVSIKRSGVAVSAGTDGHFIIGHIKAGRYILVCAAVGYVAREVMVEVPGDGLASVDIGLSISEQRLDEVVVVGYGTSRKKDMTYSVSTVSADEISGLPRDPNSALQGKVAGVQVTQAEELEKEAVDSTTPTKNLRTQFRDYAFWQPEVFTDRNGQASFSVEYPDNVTGWQTYVLGMDRKRRMGRSVRFVQSYKPLLAQISMPQFLIACDTAELVGKSLNYTTRDYNLATEFTVDGRPAGEQSVQLQARGSFIQKYTVVAPAVTARQGVEPDTLVAGFHIASTTGFKDGEERKIPVLRKGVLETNGQFWVLRRDTTVVFRASPNNESIECFAQNNTLDILLNELDYLKKYPWSCMEQTASKLRGLLMERTIRKKLNQPFTGEGPIRLLVSKLQKGQLFDGGWSWWEGGKANLFITNYAIRALLPLRENPLIAANIRNGLLYLQNQLPALQRGELLSALLTMSQTGHLIDYGKWVGKIPFDSLTVHQQWEFVRIAQLENLEYARELDFLEKKGIKGMLGSLHWGEENYHWNSDEDATTVVAFEVLENEKGRDGELNGIVQYFLEKRRGGYWRNTVASASIVTALLPYVLSSFKEIEQPGLINVTGDTSFSIRQYPYRLSMHTDQIRQLNIQKTGGGLTYLTFYQNAWNAQPQPVSNNFSIQSHFERNGHLIGQLVSGEKIRMIVGMDVVKEADYVMIEIPIPAGCTYASKVQDEWEMHKEFLKNKVVIFAEKLYRGPHRFEIELEARYNGRYTLNPVKASLMYFPTFYGRNEMRQVGVRGE